MAASFGRWSGRAVVGFFRWSGWRELFARAPLPLLALAASWGVYSFALLFVPVWVAVVTASAFELVYIGLAVVRLPASQQSRARSISLGAVVVSMAYNTLDGLFHRRPDLLAAPPLWADVALALLHGVPLAALAYLVADLLLHAPSHGPSPQNSEASKSPAMPSAASALLSGGRPRVASVEDLMQAARSLAAPFSREQLADVLDCSPSTADRLLAEALAAGSLARPARGRYQLVQSVEVANV